MRAEPRSALHLGGVAADTLAAVYGTPLLVLDTDAFDANVAAFAALGERHGIDVSYAGKALLFVALARRLAASPLGLDVCSLGELLTAERAGFARERLVLHGCGKSAAEIAAAAEGRVGRVVVDHLDELAALAAAARPERPVRILLRLNTGIEARTHAYVRTGGEDSKFGFSLDRIDAAVAAARRAPGLRLIGLHSHLGSQIFDTSPYAASLPIALDVFARALAAGAPVTDLVLGGGFGVDSLPGGERFDVAAAVAELAGEAAASARRLGIAPPRLGIEPGRAIVAAAGTSLYRVVTIKHQGRRRFAIVDGGIADNPRPALYGAYHHPELAGRVSSAPLETTTVCGRSCENDKLVEAPLPADLTAGDVLSLGTAGAYTYAMASNYNRFPRPAVVFAGGGAHRLAVRRETEADVLRNDVADA
jgi:diaminopimelate decarboxylase